MGNYEDFQIESIILEELRWKQLEFARQKVDNYEHAMTLWNLDKKLDAFEFVKPRGQILLMFENLYVDDKKILRERAFSLSKIIDGYPVTLLLSPVIDVEYHENILLLRTTEKEWSSESIEILKDEAEHFLDHGFHSFDDLYKTLKDMKSGKFVAPLNAVMHVNACNMKRDEHISAFSPVWHIGSGFSYHLFLDPDY